MSTLPERSTSLPAAPVAGERSIAHGCQLAEGGAGAGEPWSWLVRRWTVQACRAAERRLRRLDRFWRRQAKRVMRTRWPAWRRDAAFADTRRPVAGPIISLQPHPALADLGSGDFVRVRPLAEISRTLDEHGYCHGCKFMAPMALWCGQRLRVVRRVERFYDEARARMLRCQGVVLLEGVFCDGSAYPDTHGCDRMCHYFWRVEWLDRLDDLPPPPGA